MVPDELPNSERTVLEARLAKQSLKVIADRLGIHWGTVARYQYRALQHLGVNTLEEARPIWDELVRNEAIRRVT